MNFFKNVIPLIVLLCINSVNAKRTGGATTSSYAKAPADTQPKPAPAPAVKQPVIQQQAPRQLPVTQIIMQEKSYKDLVNYVKKASNAWDRANASLDIRFIFDLMEKAQQLKLDSAQLEALLQTARDAHGIFTGNQTKDQNILITIEAQIRAALAQRQNL